MDFDYLYLVWKLMTWGLRIYTYFVDIISFRAKKREKTVLKILPRIAIFLVLTARTKCPFLKLCLDGFWWSIPCLKAYDLRIKNIHLFCWYCIIKGKKTGKNSVKNPSEDSHFPSFDSQDKMSISEALPWWILMIYTLFESLWPED